VLQKNIYNKKYILVTCFRKYQVSAWRPLNYGFVCLSKIMVLNCLFDTNFTEFSITKIVVNMKSTQKNVQ